MAETFVAWRRPAITDLATAGTFAAGRLVGRLKVTLADEGGRSKATPTSCLPAPPMCTACRPASIVGRKPAPGTLDAEVTRVAHIELGDPGLPWRYSPAANSPAGVNPGSYWSSASPARRFSSRAAACASSGRRLMHTGSIFPPPGRMCTTCPVARSPASSAASAAAGQAADGGAGAGVPAG